MELADKFVLTRYKIMWLSLVIFFLTGCNTTAPAPIVEGWHQPEAKNSNYIVQKGDTVYSIAWAFMMDFRDLAKINNLSPPYHLEVGQRLLMSQQNNSFVQQKNLIPVVPIQQRPNIALLPHPATSLVKLSTPSRLPKKTLSHYSLIPSPAKIKQPYISKEKAIVKRRYRPVIVRKWLFPVHGKIVRRFSLVPGGSRGIEIAGRTGEAVVASASGKVVYSGSGLRGYGNLIIIKHNDTYLSAYAYNKKLFVREGVNVLAGQKIALMGKNNSGQARLHFEIRRNGKPIDPMKLVG